MDAVRRIIQVLWPELALETTPWIAEWQASQRDRFVKIARVFFSLAALGYVAHFFLFDLLNNLQPIHGWFLFRMTTASLCLACLAFYVSRYARHSWCRWPAILALALGCHSQAQVTLAHDAAPWIYPFLFVFGSVLVLQMSAFKSVVFAVPVIISFYPPLSEAGVQISSFLSASFLTTLVTVVARGAYGFEVQAFLVTQERDETRREVITLQNEFANQVKSFIPRVISDRIQYKMDKERLTALEAQLRVLQAKKQHVACLFSDIRGFTRGSRDLDSFLFESVIPEVKACSDAIEEYSGIPRKIGDLIFAYFDDRDPVMNVLRAVLAGITLARLNEDMNDTVSTVHVRRYILISSGDAIVGNVGGLNSGVEITALGPPVNFLSRLDDATKDPGLAELLSPGDLILSANAATQLQQVAANLNIKTVHLSQANVAIRDFPEVHDVYLLKPSPRNYDLVASAYISQQSFVQQTTDERPASVG